MICTTASLISEVKAQVRVSYNWLLVQMLEPGWNMWVVGSLSLRPGHQIWFLPLGPPWLWMWDLVKSKVEFMWQGSFNNGGQESQPGVGWSQIPFAAPTVTPTLSFDTHSTHGSKLSSNPGFFLRVTWYTSTWWHRCSACLPGWTVIDIC